MAIRRLTNWDDDLFRQVSRPVEKFDNRLWLLLDDMRDTLKKVGGYGCTSVHVGVLRRVVVILDERGVIELINPAMIDQSGSQRVHEASIAPGAPSAYVDRPQTVTVSAMDRNGNPMTVSGEGFLAATICHEIDHLDGVKFTDNMRNGGYKHGN